MTLLIFGFGFSGKALAKRLIAQGWRVAATARRPEDRQAAAALGVEAIDPADAAALQQAAGQARAILITAPPGEGGCPALQALVPAMAASGAFPDWIGYLSTTGVYGDRDGRWVTEDSALNAQSIEGARRAGMRAIGVSAKATLEAADIFTRSLLDLPADAFESLLGGRT